MANASTIAVGSLVTGNGVGREIYVSAVDVAAQTVDLSRPLYDAEGTQVFTFTKYISCTHTDIYALICQIFIYLYIIYIP